MSNVIDVCWPEVRSFRSHRYVDGTRVSSWDNQLVKIHAVALWWVIPRKSRPSAARRSKAKAKAKSSSKVRSPSRTSGIGAIGVLNCWDCQYRLIDIGSTTGSRSLPK